MMIIDDHQLDEIQEVERAVSGSRYRVPPVFEEFDPEGDEEGDKEDMCLLDGFNPRRPPRHVSNRAIKSVGVEIINARIRARKKAVIDSRWAPLVDIKVPNRKLTHKKIWACL